jgi:hypothetical protein
MIDTKEGESVASSFDSEKNETERKTFFFVTFFHRPSEMKLIVDERLIKFIFNQYFALR